MCRIDRQINLPVKGVFMALNFAAVFYAISNCSMLIQILSSPNRQSFDMSCEVPQPRGKIRVRALRSSARFTET